MYITVSKPAIIIETVEKMNDNNNEGDIIKVAGGGPPFCQIAQSANSGAISWIERVVTSDRYSTEATRIALIAVLYIILII